jgi:D-glycero-D-manno-heptose 1,7-bisphosphate phosphatase
MKVVIMAGGKGTRIASVNSEVPKPMIPLLGTPILEHQINCLKGQGYTDITLVVGHLGHVIKEYFADGSAFGVSIDYVVEDAPLGSAGALFLLKDKLTEDFLLLNGDIIFDIDVASFLKHHKEKGGLATLLTHPNNHPYDSGIIIADAEGRVKNWLHKEDERLWYRNRVNAGVHLLSPQIFEDAAGVGIFKELKKVDLDRDVLKPLIPTGQIFVYDSPEYVKDMGTPDRYAAVTEDMRTGRVQAKNRKNLQRAIFLDRDGTINRYVQFLRKPEELELIDGVAEAIVDEVPEDMEDDAQEAADGCPVTAIEVE